MDWGFFSNLGAAPLISAFLLDLAAGDPQGLPHPVVLMGKVIAYGEWRPSGGRMRHDFLSGMMLSLFLVALSATASFLLICLFNLLPPWLSFSATVTLASTTLATRGLLDAVKLVEGRLHAGDLDLVGAREKLSHIVGRDTSNLDSDKVLRASLESLSESTCDGIVAPLFYLFLGGVPLAMAYKAASTLDSMIGYRSERYFYFGKFAARLDDALNFIPARLTALFIVLAATAARSNPGRALRIAWRDHANHLSPNAGYPEAALAGAFGIRLGGPSLYFGEVVHKPYLGDDLRPVGIEMLKEGRALCLVTAMLSFATFAALAMLRS
jgi:adenosylcobinamide-phosphate synthase